MATYPYNIAVPNAPNDPADDQPEMQQNTVSISGLVSEDHIGFGFPNGGHHNVITLVQQASTPAVPGLGTNFSQLFGKQSAQYPAQVDNVLYFQNRFSSAQMTMNFTPSVVGGKGVTFLPGSSALGGLIQMFGTVAEQASSSVQTVLFPAPFPQNVFVVLITPIRTAAGPITSLSDIWVVNGSYSGANVLQFQYVNQTGHNFGINWIAIGN